jgi:hypothetical protein
MTPHVPTRRRAAVSRSPNNAAPSTIVNNVTVPGASTAPCYSGAKRKPLGCIKTKIGPAATVMAKPRSQPMPARVAAPSRSNIGSRMTPATENLKKTRSAGSSPPTTPARAIVKDVAAISAVTSPNARLCRRRRSSTAPEAAQRRDLSVSRSATNQRRRRVRANFWPLRRPGSSAESRVHARATSNHRCHEHQLSSVFSIWPAHKHGSISITAPMYKFL